MTRLRSPLTLIIGICTLLLLIAGVILLAGSGSLASLNPRTNYLRDLPRLDRQSRLYQVSSRDPNGKNKDRGHFLYEEPGRYVIMDVYGSGAIERLWMTADGIQNVGNIQLFFGDSITPTVDLPAADFFSGRVAPFLYPLVGGPEVSSGGHYSFVRLPFSQRVRVATTQLPWYYNIEYSLTAGPPAADFDGKTFDAAALQLWQQVISGTLPKFTGKAESGNYLAVGGYYVEPKREATLFTMDKPGAITSIKLKWDATLAKVGSTVNLNNLRLKIYWDGAEAAAVDAPLGFFFGSGMGEYEVRGLPVGIDPSQHLGYSYFPMPYNSARIMLVNDGPETLTGSFEIESDNRLYQPEEISKLGRFHADYNAADPPRRKLDYPILSAEGSGVYVGTTLVISGPIYLQEGNERVDLDSSRTSQFTGTGTEDYFNAAWGFQRGNFSLPTHGNPSGRFGGSVAAYRFHLTDPIPWGRSIVFGFGHGGLGRNYPYDDDSYAYSSLAYSYQRSTPTLAQTDEISFGESGNLAAHAYTNTGQVWSGNDIRGYFERTEEPVAASGVAITATGAVTFTVTIDPANNGVLLRRLLDYRTGFQRGRVSVDGLPAGTWYSPGNNPYRSWREEEFLLPASLTRGKSKLTIRVDVERDAHLPPDAAAWNEFGYWVYSLTDGQPLLAVD